MGFWESRCCDPGEPSILCDAALRQESNVHRCDLYIYHSGLVRDKWMGRYNVLRYLLNRALAHLGVRVNGIGADGAGRLAGVLGQCGALAHLDLRGNDNEGVEAAALCAAWAGSGADLRR